MLRFGIIVMFALLLILAGGLLSIPLLVRDPLPILSPQSPIALEREQGDLPVAGRLEIDGNGRFVMQLALLTEDGEDLPQVVLTMPDNRTAPLAADVERLDQHHFRAHGQITMAGRWEVSIEMAGAVDTFRFILRDF